MPDSAEPRVRRYSAFVSYNRADVAFVRRLHRRLESYRLPSAVAAACNLRGGRLRPIFRDRDELTAAPDLSEAVREALAESDFLIVICSPAAAASKWVAWEIEAFRKRHGDQPILAALIAGDSQTAFPVPLLRRRRSHGQQPLAADFRRHGDGARLGLLKLVAPLAGARLDDLIHRDGQRRMRQTATFAAAGVAGMAAMGGLAGAAFLSQQAAVRERDKAQALVGAMSTDLRTGAQDVVGLGYLGKINNAAADYFRGRDPRSLSDTALQERAKLLQNIGEDDEKRGDRAAAQHAFQEAHRDTAALLAKAPGDARRIFDHAQSEYWMGFIAMRLGDGAAARAHFQAYADLAERLVRLNPSDDTWLLETAYAANNLGMLALRQEGRPVEAQAQFQKALDIRRQIAAREPDDPKLQHHIANALAWLADAQRLAGDLDAALATRAAQRTILAALVHRSPNNLKERDSLLANDLAVARIEISQGRYERAARRLQRGHAAELELARADPDNKDFVKQARMFDLFTVKAWLGASARSRPSIAKVAAVLDQCRPPAAGIKDDELDAFCTILLARTRELAGDLPGARAALATPRPLGGSHEVLTAHWGLDLTEEAAPVRLALATSK